MAKTKVYKRLKTKPEKTGSATKTKQKSQNRKPSGFPPKTTNIHFPKSAISNRNFDFAKYYGQGFDELTFYCQRAIEKLLDECISTHGQSLSVASINGYCHSGLTKFLSFCQVFAKSMQYELTIGGLNGFVIDQFIVFLNEQSISSSSQKSIYSRIKSVLSAFVKWEWIAKLDFPKNPFPNSNRKCKGQHPLSDEERRSLVHALRKEMNHLYNAPGPLNRYDLAVCALTIAVRSGLNPTPLVELPVDCLQKHPLKRDRRLLISFKRRGNNTHIQSLRKSEDIVFFNTVLMEIAAVIEMVIKRNQGVREQIADGHRLFVYLSEANNNRGKPTVLTNAMLNQSIAQIVERHQLTDDDEKPLKLNVMRLRKTFVNRLFELSNQDPILTAALAGHDPKVSNDHYLEAPPESEKNFNLLGEIRVESLLGKDTANFPYENTAVAGCKDPKFGHLAPQNGEYCTDFLACFRCRSFVVTQDDLYRLFSLYWLLIRERKTIGAKRWAKYYKHVIRIIDKDITPQFDAEIVSGIREKAKDNPHPYWRSFEPLEESL